MGLKDTLIRLWRRGKKPEEAIEMIDSINQSSINQPIDEITQENVHADEYHGVPQSTLWATEKPHELQKDSFQLGLAAGYTGKSIRSIEDALSRIETQMVTKDWFDVNYEDNSPKIIEKLDKIDENTMKMAENIEKILKSMETAIYRAPEPLKTELYGHLQAIQSHLPLTRKQQILISVVKEVNEISYTDLAAKLDITEDGLRGLLSTTIRKANVLERFEREGKGWVKVKSNQKND